MDAAITHPQYITDNDGHKTAVIIPIDAYTELLEDLSDFAIVAERRNEKTISHKNLLESLKADGLI
ncbi:MAG: hypothetical protein ABSF43_14440 [Rectinemataceae bacterium]|jgi:hypothetical protein